MGRKVFTALVAFALVGILGDQTLGQVGEPTGFTITVKQGPNIIAQQALSIGPAGDITDTKINDGDPEGFAQIGSLTSGAPIIVKVVTGDDPLFRMLSVFINAPISLLDIHTAGPDSLFDPASPDPIEVSLSNLMFAGTTWASPLLLDSNSFFVAFMRDQGGRFYELPQANSFNSYGHGILDIQVPGERFLDGGPVPYQFLAAAGAPATATWTAIPNPGAAMTVHDGTSPGQSSMGAGYVFELGLSMAVIGIPEPSSALLLLAGLGILIRRRR